MTTDEKIVELLWNSLKRDPEHKDRRVLGFDHGSKTKTGLVATIRRIIEEDKHVCSACTNGHHEDPQPNGCTCPCHGG